MMQDEFICERSMQGVPFKSRNVLNFQDLEMTIFVHCYERCHQQVLFKNQRKLCLKDLGDYQFVIGHFLDLECFQLLIVFSKAMILMLRLSMERDVEFRDSY